MKWEKISFVIPCYRSEYTLKHVVSELKSHFELIQNRYDYEVILVNDASPDHVWEVIEQLAAEDERIRGVSFSRNFGQHAALLAGYARASGDIIFSLDDDGQAPVESVPVMIEKLQEGYDVVFGSYPEIQQTMFRRFGTFLNARMSESLLGKPKDVDCTSFFVMKRFIADEILRYQNAYPNVSGLIFRSTKNITNLEVHQRKRESGESGYTIFKLISLWMNGFTAFSVKPLRMMTYFGCGVGVVGFVYLIRILVCKLMGIVSVAGWSSLMAVLLVIGGAILFSLGMLGEYIGRIYICLNAAPQYIVREETQTKPEMKTVSDGERVADNEEN